MLLKDRTAIVTGGAVGIGKGIATRFAAEGARVVIADISEKNGAATEAEIKDAGGSALFVRCDVTSRDEVRNMVDATVSAFGGVDILVNNAGGVPNIKGETLEEITDDEWQLFIDLNLKSVFLCCQAAVPYMKKQKYGKIVNFSSLGAVHPAVSVVHYHSAKGGVISMTYNLAYELAPHNIYVNCILPGPVKTPFWDPVVKDVEDVDAYFNEIGRREVPLGRVATPEDIAGNALYLASDLSSYVSGQMLYVGGGQPLLPHSFTLAGERQT